MSPGASPAADSASGSALAASRAAVLVDASNYYAALRSVLLQAKSRVFIAGWDIDSRTPIRGATAPADGAPKTLGPLLTYLVRRNPALEVFVLLWDYSMLYATEREPLPRVNLDWRTPARVHVRLDAALPIGASHHEKLVVVDDAVAFCGGLDLTIRRWDTPAHRAHEPDRLDPGGKPYGPFHDVQLVVDGEAAGAIAAIIRQRWTAAGSADAPPVNPVGEPWPRGVEADLTDVTMRIARTRAPYAEQPALRQVEAAYVVAVERAERFVYIESQYLTALAVADALRKRLAACADLEALIFTSADPGGWLEARTMGTGRQRFLARLGDALREDRVRVRYPYVTADGEQVAIKVHSKLLIVDDCLMQIGSSNLNNRSMGVDTECDLIVAAQSAAQREAISRVRRRLLAEHLGIEPGELAERERRYGSPLAVMDSLRSAARGVAAIASHGPTEDDPLTMALTEVADPEAPLDPEAFVGDLFGARHVRPLLRRTEHLLIFPALLLVLIAAWRYLPVADWLSPQRWGPWLQAVSGSAWGGPAVVLAFVAGSIVIFPISVLIVATAVAFGPWSGFVWALCGCVLGAAANFAMGRWLGKRLFAGIAGNRFKTVSERLARGGIVPVMVIRNVPVAPFTVVSIAAGASPIRLGDFLLGTALGMAPGIGAVTLLGDRLRGVWQHPTALNLGLLGAAIVLWIGLALGLQSLSNRFWRR